MFLERRTKNVVSSRALLTILTSRSILLRPGRPKKCKATRASWSKSRSRRSRLSKKWSRWSLNSRCLRVMTLQLQLFGRKSVLIFSRYARLLSLKMRNFVTDAKSLSSKVCNLLMQSIRRVMSKTRSYPSPNLKCTYTLHKSSSHQWPSWKRIQVYPRYLVSYTPYSNRLLELLGPPQVG